MDRFIAIVCAAIFVFTPWVIGDEVASSSVATQPSISSADERFGAAPDALGPIGGGAGYKRMVEKIDFRVATIDELLDVLKQAKPGQVVYVDDKAELDLTVRVVTEKLVIEVPGGITLASGRGREGSQGALIFSDELVTSPLFVVAGPKTRITGLRVRGPDPYARIEEIRRLFKLGGHDLYYRLPNSDGVWIAHPDCEIDNCELSAWSHAALFLQEGARNTRVNHNYIHHCQRSGLGYGVCLDAADALIESNVFDYYRHAIASTGRPGSRYEACNNLVLEHAVGHAFDMHGGSDRKDGTIIAGDWIRIHHNTFKVTTQCDIKVRGEPVEGGEVHHNWFLNTKEEDVYRQSVGDNVRVYRNSYGPKSEIR